MEIISHLQEALANLLSAKLRSFLAVLGILVGSASVVAMVSSGQLATQQALAQFKQLGTNLLAVTITGTQNPTDKSKRKSILTVPVAQGLSTVNPGIDQVAPYISTFSPIIYKGHPIDGTILGVTQSLQSVVKIKIDKGRFISDLDGFSYFCVLGHAIYQQMQQYGVINPIGDQIRLGNTIYTIVGVAKQWPENSFMFDDINNAILIPIHTARMMRGYTDINNVVFTLKKNADIDAIESSIRTYLNTNVPGKKLFFRSAKQLIQSMKNQRQILTLLLGLIGSISLIVGGIGVMNIMLVSVVERHKEIGIRMAVGARRRDIQTMFLIESVALSLFGGVIGVISGILTAFIIAVIAGWSFTLFLLPPLIGFLVSAAVGIFFGYYPAYQASRLDPIMTLRAE